MPFLGMDWRTPGEQWVRDGRGEWMRMGVVRKKVLSKLHQKTLSRNDYYADPYVKTPQTYILLRKNNASAPLGEAFSDLEMVDAVKDLRKFSYVCAMVGHLLRNNLPYLSGEAQKTLIHILKCIVQRTVSSNCNNRQTRDLLCDLELTLTEGLYDHLGSGDMWRQHWRELEEMKVEVERFERKLMSNDDDNEDDNNDDNTLKLDNLPPEILHLILLRLNNHNDISNTFHSFNNPTHNTIEQPQHNTLEETQQQQQRHDDLQQQPPLNSLQQHSIQIPQQPQNSPSQSIFHYTTPQSSPSQTTLFHYTSPQNTPPQNNLFNYTTPQNSPPQTTFHHHTPPQDTIDTEAQEIYFKRLCIYHFPDKKKWFQVLQLKDHNSFRGWTWAMLYRKLSKRFKFPMDFANSLMLCKHCTALYWKLEGHPCCFHTHKPSSRPIPPEAFARLFAM